MRVVETKAGLLALTLPNYVDEMTRHKLEELVNPDGKFNPEKKWDGSNPKPPIIVTEEDIKDAIREWNKAMPDEYIELLGKDEVE